MCPPHYAGEVTPWDLEKCMASTGDAFIDARRTDAIEYCFRLKEDLRGDLVKARHCIDAAIAHFDKMPVPSGEPPAYLQVRAPTS